MLADAGFARDCLGDVNQKPIGSWQHSWCRTIIAAATFPTIDGIDGRDDHAIARLQRSQPRPRCLAAISLLLADCVCRTDSRGRDQWLSEGRVAAAARQRWLLERYRC